MADFAKPAVVNEYYHNCCVIKNTFTPKKIIIWTRPTAGNCIQYSTL